MAYISNDGSLLKVEPWGRRSASFFMGIIHVVCLFFGSLINPVVSILGPGTDDRGRYGTQSRDGPGSGPPRPPRRMGRPNLGGSGVNTPGPCGGCGCG